MPGPLPRPRVAAELPAGNRAFVPVALFLLTFLTTTASGAIRRHAPVDVPAWQFLFPIAAIRPISDGLTYSVPLMLILLCHELGHYFVARAHGVPASLPYFIPLPPVFGLGTMGAVIGMRQVSTDRRKLIDIGAAGPLAGLLIAIPVTAYGLWLSPVEGLHPGGMQEGNSILYLLLKLLMKGAWLPDGTNDVILHPTAFAGWAGLLVTMINLIPIGQLDGGHVASAYFGNRYNRFARGLYRVLPFIAAGVFVWVMFQLRAETAGTSRYSTGLAIEVALGGAMPWLIWWFMLGLVRRLSGSNDHPPVEDRGLVRSRRALFWLMVVVFGVLLMPVPMRMSLAGVELPERAAVTMPVTPPTVGPRP